MLGGEVLESEVRYTPFGLRTMPIPPDGGCAFVIRPDWKGGGSVRSGLVKACLVGYVGGGDCRGACSCDCRGDVIEVTGAVVGYELAIVG